MKRLRKVWNESLKSPRAQSAAAPPPTAGSVPEPRYYALLMAAFVAVLLCADLIGPAKIAQVPLPYLGPITFGAGVVFFPLSYLFGDVLTEVYGFARARKVVWAGFGALLFASVMSMAVVAFPPAPEWPNQQAYETVFGQVPRIALGSLLGFWAGEFSNSFVLAKMKLHTQGRWLWTRTIGSTVVGELVDSVIFYSIAFGGLWTPEQIREVMLTNYCIKCIWEIIATPLTYTVVMWLKRHEGIDHFDRSTDFNPFSWR